MCWKQVLWLPHCLISIHSVTWPTPSGVCCASGQSETSGDYTECVTFFHLQMTGARVTLNKKCVLYIKNPTSNLYIYQPADNLWILTFLPKYPPYHIRNILTIPYHIRAFSPTLVYTTTFQHGTRRNSRYRCQDAPGDFTSASFARCSSLQQSACFAAPPQGTPRSAHYCFRGGRDVFRTHSCLRPVHPENSPSTPPTETIVRIS